MTSENKPKQPSITQLVAAIKEHNDLVVTKADITDEIYNNATKGYQRGVSLKSMANRCRFYLVGSGKDSEPKETVSARGVFYGSRDIATEKKPLGKNKSQTLSFLQKGDDGMFRVFTDPNAPSHFKGFKKDRFGMLVDVDFAFTKKGDVTYVSPENVTPVDKAFEIDTSKIKVHPITALPDLEDFTACAVVGTIASFKPARVPPWEQDKYDDEDYPLIINKNPVFTLYLESDEEKGEPIIKGVVNPTHLSKPFIQLDDFEMVMPEDINDVVDDEEFLFDEITPMYNGVEVILVGQKKRASDYDDKVFVDFDITAIIPVEGSPSLIETKSGVKRAKDAKAKKGKDKVDSKKESKEEDAEKESKKAAIRQAEVAKVVTAMLDATTVAVVKDMVEKKYLTGVSDEVIQEYIYAEFEAQGIPTEEVEEESETRESSEEIETEADDEPENADDKDDVWAE